MAINMQEYNALKELRNALAAIPIAQKRIAELQGLQQKSQGIVNEADAYIRSPKPSTCTTYRDKVQGKYEEPARKKDREDNERRKRAADHRDRRRTATRITIFVLFAIAVFGVGVLLAYIAAESTWTASITSLTRTMRDLMDGNQKTSIGLNLFALGFSLLVLGGLSFLLALIPKTQDVLGMTGVVLIGGSIIAGIASFPYYYNAVSGFISLINHLLGIVVCIPSFFGAVAKIFPFTLIIAATILCIVAVIRLCEYFHTNHPYETPTSKIIRQDALRALDYKQLYASELYKNATKLDEDTAKENDRIKLANKNLDAQYHSGLLRQYKEEINKLTVFLAKCRQIVNNATFLHPSRRTIQGVDQILYYFDYNRAETIVQAVNERVRDEQFLAIWEKLTQIQRQQLTAMNRAVEQITQKLDRMETSLTQEIFYVRQKVEHQTKVIREEAERTRAANEEIAKKNREAAQKRADQLQSQLSNYYWDLYRRGII